MRTPRVQVPLLIDVQCPRASGSTDAKTNSLSLLWLSVCLFMCVGEEVSKVGDIPVPFCSSFCLFSLFSLLFQFFPSRRPAFPPCLFHTIQLVLLYFSFSPNPPLFPLVLRVPPFSSQLHSCIMPSYFCLPPLIGDRNPRVPSLLFN